MRSRFSTMVRPTDGRSEAPSTATERGVRSASRSMARFLLPTCGGHDDARSSGCQTGPALSWDAMSEASEAEQAAAHRRQRAVEVQSGAARAAVLGINDGLVTNTAMILGVVGATDAAGIVKLAGLASLVAGACSMGAGEYVSMRAQVELLERL